MSDQNGTKKYEISAALELARIKLAQSAIRISCLLARYREEDRGGKAAVSA